MAHGTFGENDGDANATYVASIKRQKAIRRYVKLFFRLMAAIAIIVLAALVIILALELDKCRNDDKCSHDQFDQLVNKTCSGISTGDHCLTLNPPDTWDNANEKCNTFGQRLPSPSDVKHPSWVTEYLSGTWGNRRNTVFGTSGDVENILGNGSAGIKNKYFCVD
ncbi:EEV glycoprotein [Bovine papular stomatitis virus]